MKRRDFLTATAITTAISITSQSHAADKAPDTKQYLELRQYEFSSRQKQNAFENFLAKAAIPALNRQSIKPIGVFKAADDQSTDLWLLIPHNTAESAIASNSKMLADPLFKQAGSDIITCPKTDLAYKRFTSSLLLAFDKCPKAEVPSRKSSRIFQLRIYESHNTTMAKRKIEMFNTGGEIDLFRSTGLNPVFFGESIVGSKMPNLTYMVGFDDTEAQTKAWATFQKHPKWTKLKSDPYYKDTVSNITNIVLRPSDSSQI
ncbi:MAG: NIPSNAP family protein [Phycisphaerae bacterium]|nr:NIPSNAP family protein [Phycisphaerae bacterium]